MRRIDYLRSARKEDIVSMLIFISAVAACGMLEKDYHAKDENEWEEWLETDIDEIPWWVR